MNIDIAAMQLFNGISLFSILLQFFKGYSLNQNLLVGSQAQALSNFYQDL